eukprot:13461617-Alexandrium_andersonii.AAC.1
MSASLVGSEMCIRDRLQTAPTDRRVAMRLAGGCFCFSLPQLHPNEAARTSCLLYTSDAADDM